MNQARIIKKLSKLKAEDERLFAQAEDAAHNHDWNLLRGATGKIRTNQSKREVLNEVLKEMKKEEKYMVRHYGKGTKKQTKNRKPGLSLQS